MDQPQYKISWQRWLDPLKRLMDDYKKSKNKGHDEFDDFERSDLEDLHAYNGPVAQTAHGIIPINESNLPSTVFNLWRADINFNMTQNVELIINNVLGVEAYDLITPLRFRIAIGKLFDENDVKRRVTEAVLNYKNSLIQPKETSPKAHDFSLLHKQFKHFAVMLTGTKKTILHGKTSQEVKEKIETFLAANPTSHVEYVSP